MLLAEVVKSFGTADVAQAEVYMQALQGRMAKLRAALL